MNDLYYRLYPDHTVKPCSVNEWARNFEICDRVVRNTTIGGATISTVFIGLDHNYSNDGPPLLFETMIFGGQHNNYQERYATWDEAVAGHDEAVQLVELVKQANEKETP